VGSKRDRARQAACRSPVKISPPRFLSERQGDVRHSLASIGKGRRLLGFQPTIKIQEGIGITVEEFIGSYRWVGRKGLRA